MQPVEYFLLMFLIRKWLFGNCLWLLKRLFFLQKKICKLSLAIPRKLIIEEQFFHAKSFSWQIVEWATRQSQQGRRKQRGRGQPQPKNPTIYNIIRWIAGSLGQMTIRPSV